MIVLNISRRIDTLSEKMLFYRLICTPYVSATKGVTKARPHEIIGKLGMYDFHTPT